MSVIFVTHDIGAAVEVADRIAVMYGGRIVDENTVKGIVTTPRHPYKAGFLASTVSHDNPSKPLPAVRGELTNLAALPPVWSFAPRCDNANERCLSERPAIISSGGERLACLNPVVPLDICDRVAALNLNRLCKLE